MNKYVVYFKAWYEVEAKDETDAEDKALDCLDADIQNGSVHSTIEEQQENPDG